MADTFAKKALQQKKAKKKKEKKERKEERKSNNNKGKDVAEMMAYVDEFGNLTDVPQDIHHRKEVDIEDIQLGAKAVEKQTEFTGVLTTYFDEKSFGFITEDNTHISVFVHSNQMAEPLSERDKVIYEKEKTPKGFSAVNVRKVK